jgi:lipopolysaccharide/colanic/teichoic acid biosynthesis glycosyltransferase
MNDFFKTKVAFLLGLFPILWILTPFVVPNLKDISINIFTIKISAGTVYYVMIVAIFPSLFSYAVVFIKEGRFKIFKAIGDFFYPTFLILPILFLFLFVAQNAVLPITNQLNPQVIIPIELLVFIIFIIFIIIKSSKKIEKILEEIYNKTLDDILLLHNPGNSIINNFKIRAFDLVLSITFILFLLPLILIISLVIKLESKGPIFYSELRIGKGGRKFDLFKFRCVKEISSKLRIENGNNINTYSTVFGKILKRTALDELPKLFNITIGDTSFVGPYPLNLHSDNKNFLNDEVRNLYLSIRPGMIGLPKLKSRSLSTSFYEDNLKLDFYYIKNRSLKLNLMIMFSTSKSLLFYT